MLVRLLGGHLEVSLVDDVVPVKDAPGLVARYQHCDYLRHAIPQRFKSVNENRCDNLVHSLLRPLALHDNAVDDCMRYLVCPMIFGC